MASASRIYAEQVHCKYHPDAILTEDYHAGDTICPECGLVVGDRVIDVGAEWRTFSNDQAAKDACRVGAAENSLLEGGGDLSTRITMASGNSAVAANEQPVYHKRKTVSSSDHALSNAFGEIKTMADRLNSSWATVDRANRLFKHIYEGKKLKGRSYHGIAAACLFIACRQEQVPRTFKEICAVSNCSKKEIGRTVKLIVRVQGTDTRFEALCSQDFMSRFCSYLQLSHAIQTVATHIARCAAELKDVRSKSPLSIAAAAIYMASQASEEKKMAKDIGDISGVAESTIRQVYKLMLPHAASLFPEDFKSAAIL